MSFLSDSVAKLRKVVSCGTRTTGCFEMRSIVADLCPLKRGRFRVRYSNLLTLFCYTSDCRSYKGHCFTHTLML